MIWDNKRLMISVDVLLPTFSGRGIRSESAQIGGEDPDPFSGTQVPYHLMGGRDRHGLPRRQAEANKGRRLRTRFHLSAPQGEPVEDERASILDPDPERILALPCSDQAHPDEPAQDALRHAV